ncbi:hypothetical protein FHX81_7010 [Saccharothrix saharensis]|uniref:non-specific serine/threonine protein kinase n=1 Tax=Saccharothrix saharensis TaxID=571190 RepID=A0A543JP71_9PSEU|nr:hypothetical protein [Saccharothrix saharensis]TQM84555.1 hypothetical protein FHX81_7010 [Saccharothrix saharensis]
MEEQIQTPSGTSSTHNAVHGPVSGSLVQAGNIYGGVHYHQVGSSPESPAPDRTDRRRSGLGPEVEVGAVTYLVHEQPAGARPTGDSGAVVRQARCSGLAPRDGFGWLRRIDVRVATPLTRQVQQALAAEHDLLRRLSGGVPGLPAVLQFVEDPGGTTTLVTRWPETRSRRPCDPLDALLLNGPVRDPGVLSRVRRALAGLCATLDALHSRRVVHGALTPAGLLMRDDGALLLRDLGRTDPTPPEYPAPEQLERAAAGPWTDVHQVGAIAHHLVTGRPPSPRAALPVRRWEPGIPADLAEAIDAALVADPAKRLSAAVLGTRLRGLAHPTR